jgi:hypothetical protein
MSGSATTFDSVPVACHVASVNDSRNLMLTKKQSSCLLPFPTSLSTLNLLPPPAGSAQPKNGVSSQTNNREVRREVNRVVDTEPTGEWLQKRNSLRDWRGSLIRIWLGAPSRFFHTLKQARSSVILSNSVPGVIHKSLVREGHTLWHSSHTVCADTVSVPTGCQDATGPLLG